MEKNIVFRVDGGNLYSIAMGHVYKCVRVAKYSGRDVTILFIMKDYAEGVSYVRTAGFDIELIDRSISPEKEAEIVISLVIKLKAILYIDQRNTKKYLVANANKRGVSTVVYEDISLEDIEPTILINPSFLANTEINYKHTSRKTRYLLGLDYMVLEPDIASYRRRSFSCEINNLFLCFGGADPCNISSKVLKILLTKKNLFKIILVLGPAFKHHHEIKSLLLNEDNQQIIEIVNYSKNLLQIMTRCDAAVTSGGTIAYESIALSIPTLVLPSIESEAKNISPLIGKGLVAGIKRDVAHIENNELDISIRNFLKDNIGREKLYNASEMINLTGGIKRVVQSISDLSRS